MKQELPKHYRNEQGKENKGEQPEQEMGEISLNNLGAGELFIHGSTIGLKSEYRTDSGAIEAFIVGTGEMFWGGTNTGDKQRELLVKPFSIIDLWRDIDLILDYADFDDLAKYKMIKEAVYLFNKTIMP